MKIGVLGVFHSCADVLPQSLKPWVELKQSHDDIVLGGIHAQFKDYAELGYTSEDEATLNALKAENAFDILLIESEPLTEAEVRTKLLKKLLEHDVDLIWMLDGDEVYTVEQIRNCLDFIKKTEFDHYHIYFDNRIYGDLKWRNEFSPPRIFRTNRRGGIKQFSWDNDVLFNDGTEAHQLVPGIIPKSLAHVLHYTWRKDEVEKKINYHLKHFGQSIYVFDKVTGIDVNPVYFAQSGEEAPKRLPDGSFEPSPLPSLHVILRTHCGPDFRQGLPRLSDTLGGKRELAHRSLRTLVRSLLVLERSNSCHIQLTIADDHSDESFLQQVRTEIQMCGFKVELIPLEDQGNAASMEFCLNHAKNKASDFVYLVEDDYLHEPTAMLEMVQSWKIFSRNLPNQHVALFPVDYSDFYLPDRIEPTRIVLGSNCHWRTIYSSTCTFFITQELLTAQWELFMNAPKSGMNELESVNKIWQQHALLFSPVPTLAIHLHGPDLLPLYSNWRRLWDEVESPLYV